MAAGLVPRELRQSRWGWGDLGKLAPRELMDGTTSQELEWARSLPAARQENFLRSRFLVRQWLAHWLGCKPMAVPLTAPPGQAPHLGEEWGTVSWSHSGQRLLLGWSPQAVGVDLERANRPLAAQALLQRFFPLQEQQQLSCLSASELHGAVLRSWVAKEALIKQRRSSISLELGHWWMESNQPRAMYLPTGVWWPVQVHFLSFGAEQWFLGWSGDNSPSLEYLDCS
ncbi:4'-phosphopantetheinyl transferase superfamily protein [Synechococcus lacustris]|uniref:4'-phosphopantetheinyl transferase family protein n=1 Tax=Synechococcus lacustris TaxID=2116544 RepID=UPI00333FCDF2